jgi:hypothetical protein
MLNMGVGIMRPTFNLEPKCRVTMLTREERIRGPGTPPVVKGLVCFWFTYGSRTMEGTGAGVFGKKAQYLSRKHATVFQAKYMLSWPVSMKFK